MDESLAKIRHERSKKDFPFLTLEDEEYVEFAFKRARICLLLIMCGTSLAIIVILLAFLLTLLEQDLLDITGKNFLFIILLALLVSTILISIVSVMIYRNNRLFITNRHVIQMIMESPVSKSVNIIDLSSIEDASFHQNGLMQSFFHYGTLRLATVGDETTYTFKYSDIASDDLKTVTKLITDAKTKKARRKKTSHQIDEDSDSDDQQD